MSTPILSTSPARTPFTELLDLANEKMGGQALFANDEFFAAKDNLLKAAAPIFIADKYVDTGKWMDGWESRRKRGPGHDYCIVKLGVPGEIRGVNIDTSFFTGNYPEYASLEACEADAGASVQQLEEKKWDEILVKSALQGGSHNLFAISSTKRYSHMRLRIFPDGGVARLRVHGIAKPDPAKLSGTIDLAAAENGAMVITANDMYFGPKDNLILPGRAKTMGEGWETRRKRGPGNDWIILKLCGRGVISKIEVDTNHFKGNFPDRCSVDVLESSHDFLACDFRDRKELSWKEILPQTKLEAHKQQYFEIKNAPTATYLRLSIYPDGGVSRLRVHGKLA